MVLDYSHSKEWNWTPILRHSQKLTWNGLDLNIRPETVKLLEENRGKMLLDIGLGNDFLDMTPKTRATKAIINKWGYIKLKSFWTT